MSYLRVKIQKKDFFMPEILPHRYISFVCLMGKSRKYSVKIYLSDNSKLGRFFVLNLDNSTVQYHTSYQLKRK